MDLSSAEREALDRLVPREQQTGDLRADLIAAAREAMRRREQNTVDGGHVIAALYRDTRSWRTLAWVTDIPTSTARRWHVPPAEIGEMSPETPDTPPQS